MLEIAHEEKDYGVLCKPVEVGEFRFTLHWLRDDERQPGRELEPYLAGVKAERNYPGEGWGFHSSEIEYGQTPAIACQHAINSFWRRVDAAKRLAAVDDIRKNHLRSGGGEC